MPVSQPAFAPPPPPPAPAAPTVPVAALAPAPELAPAVPPAPPIAQGAYGGAPTGVQHEAPITAVAAGGAVPTALSASLGSLAAPSAGFAAPSTGFAAPTAGAQSPAKPQRKLLAVVLAIVLIAVLATATIRGLTRSFTAAGIFTNQTISGEDTSSLVQSEPAPSEPATATSASSAAATDSAPSASDSVSAAPAAAPTAAASASKPAAPVALTPIQIAAQYYPSAYLTTPLGATGALKWSFDALAPAAWPDGVARSIILPGRDVQRYAAYGSTIVMPFQDQGGTEVLAGIDITTGKVKWMNAAAQGTPERLARVKGSLFAYFDNPGNLGVLLWLDPETGVTIKRLVVADLITETKAATDLSTALTTVNSDPNSGVVVTTVPAVGPLGTPTSGTTTVVNERGERVWSAPIATPSREFSSINAQYVGAGNQIFDVTNGKVIQTFAGNNYVDVKAPGTGFRVKNYAGSQASMSFFTAPNSAVNLTPSFAHSGWAGQYPGAPWLLLDPKGKTLRAVTANGGSTWDVQGVSDLGNQCGPVSTLAILGADNKPVHTGFDSASGRKLWEVRGTADPTTARCDGSHEYLRNADKNAILRVDLVTGAPTQWATIAPGSEATFAAVAGIAAISATTINFYS